jgi:hypothetical protein
VDALALGQPHTESSGNLVSNNSISDSSNKELSPEQQALAELMSLLLLNPDQIALLGFQLGTDLSRLNNSFPWLYPALEKNQTTESVGGLEVRLEHTPAEQTHPSALLGGARINKAFEGVEVSYVEMTSLARSADPGKFLLRLGGPHTLSLSRLTQEVSWSLHTGCHMMMLWAMDRVTRIIYIKQLSC